MEEKRKLIDCRWFPGAKKCTLSISGAEDEVMKTAVDHAVKVHGKEDTPEFRNELRHLLKEAKD